MPPPDAWAAPTGAIGNPLGSDWRRWRIRQWRRNRQRRGNGIGNGNGSGAGGGNGGGIYSVGNGTTPPSVLSKVDPEYSEEARKAKYSGSVMLSIVVNTDGKAEDIKVVKSLGMGLDEKAIEAVQKWRFTPGKNKGVARQSQRPDRSQLPAVVGLCGAELRLCRRASARRGLRKSRLQNTATHLLGHILRSPHSQRQNRQRRILRTAHHKTTSIHHEKILNIVALIPLDSARWFSDSSPIRHVPSS